MPGPRSGGRRWSGPVLTGALTLVTGLLAVATNLATGLTPESWTVTRNPAVMWPVVGVLLLVTVGLAVRAARSGGDPAPSGAAAPGEDAAQDGAAAPDDPDPGGGPGRRSVSAGGDISGSVITQGDRSPVHRRPGRRPPRG